MVEAQARYMAARAEVAEAKSKDADPQHDTARIEEISSRMLRREMRVLGVMNSLDSEQEVALAICEIWAVWPSRNINAFLRTVSIPNWAQHTWFCC